MQPTAVARIALLPYRPTLVISDNHLHITSAGWSIGEHKTSLDEQ